MNENNNDQQYKNYKEEQFLIILKYYGVIFIILNILVYLFRKSKRMITIIIFYLVYHLTSVDNSFYLCLKKPDTLLPQCIHSTELNQTRILPHPNFNFNIPINIEKLESKFNNNNQKKYKGYIGDEQEVFNKCNDIIQYKRRNKEGFNKLLPTFKNQCNVKMELNENQDKYIVPYKVNNGGSGIVYLTKPTIDGIDNDGYYLFMILFTIFMDEVVREIDGGWGKPNKKLIKSIKSFSIFSIFFMVISILLITIKSRFDQSYPHPTELELLDFYNYMKSKNQ